MWAGSRLEFIKPIATHQSIRRESEILKVELKHGKSGDMYFVTVQHSIYAENDLAIIEEQDIVYRDVSTQVQRAPQTQLENAETKAFDYKNRSYRSCDAIQVFGCDIQWTSYSL